MGALLGATISVAWSAETNDAANPMNTPFTQWAILGWTLIVLGPLVAGGAIADSKKGVGGGVLLTIIGVGIAAENGGLAGDGPGWFWPVTIAAFATGLLVRSIDRIQKRRAAARASAGPPGALARAAQGAAVEPSPALTIEDKYILEGAKSFPVVGIPTLYVRYQKASGEEVEHEIDVTRIAFEDGEIARMTAKRKDAEGLRTFLLPRVQEVAVAATGEIIDDLEGLLRAGAARAMK